MAMSARRKAVRALWVRNGSLPHRFVRQDVRAKRTCLVCADNPGAEQHEVRRPHCKAA